MAALCLTLCEIGFYPLNKVIVYNSYFLFIIKFEYLECIVERGEDLLRQYFYKVGKIFKII